MEIRSNIAIAQEDIGKVKGILFAIEAAYLDIETIPSEAERNNHRVNTFYALCDAVDRLEHDIDEIEKSLK